MFKTQVKLGNTSKTFIIFNTQARRRDEIPPFLLYGICFKIVIYSENDCIELVFDGIDYINYLDLI